MYYRDLRRLSNEARRQTLVPVGNIIHVSWSVREISSRVTPTGGVDRSRDCWRESPVSSQRSEWPLIQINDHVISGNSELSTPSPVFVLPVDSERRIVYFQVVFMSLETNFMGVYVPGIQNLCLPHFTFIVWTFRPETSKTTGWCDPSSSAYPTGGEHGDLILHDTGHLYFIFPFTLNVDSSPSFPPFTKDLLP